jgi:hypothetical protein
MKWSRAPLSCTGRLTAPTDHPVPCPSATTPVTTGGRPLPRLAVLHLPAVAPRVGFILPCPSSWRSPPFLPPSRSPRSTSHLFFVHSYTITEAAAAPNSGRPPSSLGATPLAPLLQCTLAARHCIACRCLSAPHHAALIGTHPRV